MRRRESREGCKLQKASNNNSQGRRGLIRLIRFSNDVQNTCVKKKNVEHWQFSLNIENKKIPKYKYNIEKKKT